MTIRDILFIHGQEKSLYIKFDNYTITLFNKRYLFVIQNERKINTLRYKYKEIFSLTESDVYFILCEAV